MKLRQRKAWKVSRSKLKLARETLGLKWDVRIRSIDKHPSKGLSPNGTGMKCNGIYGTRGSRVHVIWLNPALSAAQASSTLWHELTHAYQAENPKSYLHEVPDVEDREFPKHITEEYIEYWNRPNERHARAIEAEYAPLLQLTYEV